AVAPFVHGGLPENPLEGEAEPFGGAAGRLVEGIAFPLVPAIAELVEDTRHHQVHGLGRGRVILKRRAEGDMADLDDPERRIDPLDHRVAAFHRGTRRARAGAPTGDLEADRLPERVAIAHGITPPARFRSVSRWRR